MELDIKQGILAGYWRLLRPLTRILLRNGIAFSEFSEVAKAVYVDVAAADFKVPNKKMSQARIAILTGLTRKEVSRLITRREEGKHFIQSNLNRVTRVLTGWHTNVDFTGPYGMPLELQFEDSTNVDFIELVQRYSGDMAPRAMLDELLRIRVVKETENGWYRVLTRTYLPEADALASLERLAHSVENFVETVDYNRQENDVNKRLLERDVFDDEGIKPEDLPRFRMFVKERSQLLLEEIDNWLNQLDKPKQGDPSVNTGLGIYHYVKGIRNIKIK